MLDFDPSVASQTLQNFEPAIPITAESLVFAGIALIIGWGERIFALGRSAAAGASAKPAGKSPAPPDG